MQLHPLSYFQIYIQCTLWFFHRSFNFMSRRKSSSILWLLSKNNNRFFNYTSKQHCMRDLVANLLERILQIGESWLLCTKYYPSLKVWKGGTQRDWPGPSSQKMINSCGNWKHIISHLGRSEEQAKPQVLDDEAVVSFFSSQKNLNFPISPWTPPR